MLSDIHDACTILSITCVATLSVYAHSSFLLAALSDKTVFSRKDDAMAVLFLDWIELNSGASAHRLLPRERIQFDSDILPSPLSL